MTRGFRVDEKEESNPSFPAPVFGIHWLTFSLSTDELMQLPGAWQEVDTRGRYGLGRCRVHESGAESFFDADRAVVNVPGEICETWGNDFLSWAAEVGGKLTRIDLACDVSPADQARRRMLDMRRAFMSGKCITRIERFEERRSYAPGDGFTWYFGGTQSQLMLRAYDRRGPLRLEFQWRPLDSHRLLASGIRSSGVVQCWRMLAQKLLFPFSWYADLIDGPAMSVERLQPLVTSLDSAVSAFTQQHGFTLFAFRMLGIPMRDLERQPTDQIDAKLAAKLLQWARDAGVAGGEMREFLSQLRRS